jgi:hypothetical protein
MRDRLIHDYFGVDYELVWDVVQNRIPILQHQISSILDSYQDFYRTQKAAPLTLSVLRLDKSDNCCTIVLQ